MTAINSDTYNVEENDGEAFAGESGMVDSKGLTPAENRKLLEAVRDFNKKYAVVVEEGTTVIFRQDFDSVMARTVTHRMRFADLCNAYSNSDLKVGYKNETAVFKTRANYWIKNKGRKQYLGGVFFDPSGQQIPDKLNLWQGFHIKPVPGDWSLLRTHILEIICGGNVAHFNHLMGWMATMLQHPERQGEVAVVIKGVEGVGKGILAKTLIRIIGQHAMTVSHAKHLVGNFNQHLRDCLFLFADEAFFAGDKQHVGVLKSIITEDFITIEGKGINAVQQKNFLHLMMASNEEWVVPADLAARRFFVLHALDTRVGDYKYFSDIMKQMLQGGDEAMLAELLAMDLSNFNVRQVPQTAALNDQKVLSLNTTNKWWLDCLQNGYVFKSRLGLEDTFSVWMETIPTKLLYESYSAFAKANGERHSLNQAHLGRFMVKIKAKPTKPDEIFPVGESRKDLVSDAVKQTRPPCYNLGNLEKARKDFCEFTKLTIDWIDAEVQPTSASEVQPFLPAGALPNAPWHTKKEQVRVH